MKTEKDDTRYVVTVEENELTVDGRPLPPGTKIGCFSETGDLEVHVPDGAPVNYEDEARSLIATAYAEHRIARNRARRGIVHAINMSQVHARWAGTLPAVALIPSPAQAHFVAVGSDGLLLVVWGLGTTREAAALDARKQEGVGSFAILPASGEAAALVESGEIACEGDGPLWLEGFRITKDGGWVAERLSVRPGEK